MSYRNGRGGEYVVPSYQALDGAAWYHFLHGNVPGHEIDFIYRPDVPQGPLTEQHFSHLARLMKYIEPPASGSYAFAIGNLSRDDTQHEPGHGGVALLFGLRIHGALDHAGRNDPPFAHAVAAIDRELDPAILLESAMAFHQRVLGATGPSGWYPDYARCATEGPFAARRTLETYVSSFDDLPRPPPSTMGLKWTSGGARSAKRVVIAHENGASFGTIARCAARLVAMLYQSDLRWTSVSNGREADVPNGISIRFVAERDLVLDPTERIHLIQDIPEEEAEIARELFDATAAAAEERPAMQGWRERYSDQRIPSMRSRAAETPQLPGKDPAITTRIEEVEEVPRSSSPEPLTATVTPSETPLGADPEDTQVMAPGAVSTAVEEADELSIDCSSFTTIAPQLAATESPVGPADERVEEAGTAPVKLVRSRRLLVGLGLVGSAAMIALLMTTIPTTPDKLVAPQERDAGPGEEPSFPIAVPAPETTAATVGSSPAIAPKAPGSSKRSGGKPPPGKPLASPRGGTRTADPDPSSSGAKPRSPVEPSPAPQGKEAPTTSSIFGATRKKTQGP